MNMMEQEYLGNGMASDCNGELRMIASMVLLACEDYIRGSENKIDWRTAKEYLFSANRNGFLCLENVAPYLNIDADQLRQRVQRMRQQRGSQHAY